MKTSPSIVSVKEPVSTQPITGKIARRHFLISSAAMLAACFVPAALLRRARDYQLNTKQPLIEGPTDPKNTLYASWQGNNWQLALGYPTEELPAKPTWRKWLRDYEHIDPENHAAVIEWFEEECLDLPDFRNRAWLDSEVNDTMWASYLESGFFVADSPEAKALAYLSSLNLGHGLVTDSNGRKVGTLSFHEGDMPGWDSHFVEAEGELILPALQHRLRELGEDTVIEVKDSPWASERA